MSTCSPNDLAAWRARLLSKLKQARTAPAHASPADFYIALGWISAAHCLGAISIAESDRLHELALNATEQRTAELANARMHASAQERAA